MSETGKLEELTKSLKVYVETNIELLKLEATERTSVYGATLISILIVRLSLFLFVLFTSITAGFFLGNYFEDTFTGFLLVSAFYLLLSLLLILGRKKLIEGPIRDRIVKRILDK